MTARTVALVSRSGTAVDSNAVVGGTETILGIGPAVAFFGVTGATGSWEARGAIEVSPDNGETWTQVVRFKDLTNADATPRVVRLPGAAAAAESNAGTAALQNANAGAAVILDTPWPTAVRAVSKIQSLGGGTATITIAVSV